MNLHTETITEEMSSVADRMQRILDDSWYLAGGTALALQIGHRASVDLDYFSTQPFDVQILRASLSREFVDEQITFDFEANQTLWCTIAGVKVSYITRRETLLHKPVFENKFVLAHMHDIVVMKLLAICSREEYKDYVDLACLSRETDVRLWPEWWTGVYPNQDLTSWLMALGAVEYVSEIPLITQPAYTMPPVISTIKGIVTELTSYLQKTSV
jgi:hypothetical protein